MRSYARLCETYRVSLPFRGLETGKKIATPLKPIHTHRLHRRQLTREDKVAGRASITRTV